MKIAWTHRVKVARSVVGKRRKDVKDWMSEDTKDDRRKKEDQE